MNKDPRWCVGEAEALAKKPNVLLERHCGSVRAAIGPAYPPCHAFLFYLAWHLFADHPGHERIVEIGVDRGLGTYHLARGSHGHLVLGIDPWHKVHQGLIRENMRIERRLSSDPVVYGHIPVGEIGLLFIDGAHDYPHVKLDYDIYGPLVAKGGVMVFDDITLNDDMKRFWSEIDELKEELDIGKDLTGLGVVYKE